MLEVSVVRKRMPGQAGAVLEGLQFSLGENEVVALVGPSGCGKTTLLRLIGGLDTDFQGEIRWRNGVVPRIGAVFQEPRLLPWRTVWQNILLAGPPDLAVARELLASLGLAQHEHAYPSALSLGMARRVAIARAFAIQPEVVLLDEPFVSLDPAMAEQARRVLTQAWRRHRCSALLVTHDIAEAASLADRVLTLSAGPASVEREWTVPAQDRRRGIEEGARVAAYLRVSR